ncbi:MAG TPA: phosphatase PAP2 family protein [Thermoanaerobaculia bacterium]|jgi:undecaprenyl-diphosphatase|nr:phosphatase PAP2 family protein [Thermoanaerobaculia bacterium]
MSDQRKRRYAAAAFITLLILSVFWPSPIVSINRLWIDETIDVDDLSFLGREAPSWDVVFWCVAGLLLLAIVQTATADADPREPLRQIRAIRFDRSLWRGNAIRFAIGAAITAFVWWFLDQPLIAWAEGVQSDSTEDAARILNRLGGGMNPVMLVAFFLIAGVAYRERRWVAYAIAMGMAGLGAGILAQIIKHLVGRARPELWLGPMYYAPGSSTSFPSGHTVGAFALAGVLIFGSRSWTLRVVAFLLAAGVGLSRVLAFRHWPSDVTASAVIGLVTAWIVTEALVRRGVPEQA